MALEAVGASRGGVIADELTAAVVAAGFWFAWQAAWRHHSRFRDAAGLRQAYTVAACCTISVFVVFIGGPLFVFGLSLIVVGLYQHNLLLVAWSVLAGGIGIYDVGYLYPPLVMEWVHPALYLTLAILTVMLGIICRITKRGISY